MHIQDEQLKNFILDSGLVSRAQYALAEKKAIKEKTAIGNVLVSEGALSEDDMRRVRAYALGIPFVNLKGQRIRFDVLALIPEPIARKHNVVAYKKGVDALEVAMLDTDTARAIEFVKKKAGLKIIPRLTDSASIKDALIQYQKMLKDEFGDIIKRESESFASVSEAADVSATEAYVKTRAEDPPATHLVDALLKHAIMQNASDVHIEPMELEVLVRYRIDGVLHEAMKLPKTAAPSIAARVKVLANMTLGEQRLPQDGRFKVELNHEKVALRVSVLPTYYGEKVVMRLSREGGGYTFEGLGFHGEGLEVVHEALKEKTGMILATGPAGSGKTTTLYTMLDTLNTPDVNISTIEDPVEYQIPRVNQTQVRADIGLTFASGLRSILRQDPDVIMVGELRDSETASLAVSASLTGRRVFSALHARSAAEGIMRLVDMNFDPLAVAGNVRVIIGQQWVSELDAEKESYKLTKTQLDALAERADMDKVLAALQAERMIDANHGWDDVKFYRSQPSLEREDGHKARAIMYEVLRVTPTIQERIIKRASVDEITEQARKEGMLSMLEDGIFKAAQGIISLEEVLRVVAE